MADQNNRPRRRIVAEDDDEPVAQAPRRRSVLDDDDDLVGPRSLSAPRARRGGSRGGSATGSSADSMIALVKDLPHFGRLVYRLARDTRVEMLDKVLVGAALAYAVMPADAIPDPIPFIGELDDVVVVGAALARLIHNCGEDLLHEHWTGDPASLEAALAVVERGASLLPAPLRSLLMAGGR